MIRQHFESGGNSLESAMRINKDECLAIKLVVQGITDTGQESGTDLPTFIFFFFG